MDVTVNPGNVHDSVAFDGLYDRLVQTFSEINSVVMDAGYKTPWICKKVFDDNRITVLSYKRPMGISFSHCTNSAKHEKLVTRHIWADYIDCAEDIRLKFAAMNLKKYVRSTSVSRTAKTVFYPFFQICFLNKFSPDSC